MALDLTATYPGQLDPGNPTGYPYGEARNITVVGDGTGFPLERDWVNDLLGFEQALLDAAGITPTGDPDEVGASQYLEAVQTIIEDHEFATLEAVDATFTGELTVAVGATLVCDGTAEFNGVTLFNFPVAFDASATFDATSFSETAVFNAALGFQVTQVAQFDGQVNFGGLLFIGAAGIINAGGYLGAGAIFTDNVEFQDPVSFTGDGRLRKRLVELTDGDASISPANADVYYMGSAVQTAPRTLTIDETGLDDGDTLIVTTQHAGNALTINGEGGFSTSVQNTNGSSCSVMIIREGAGYRHVDLGDKSA